MPLKNVPDSIIPELLYALAKMGHGDKLVIADANFPSDSVASHCIIKTPIRVHGKTSDALKDILTLLLLDQYVPKPVGMMDRVDADKAKNFHVPAYQLVTEAAQLNSIQDIDYVERFQFYECAKKTFVIVQTDDKILYANVIISKGVL